MIFVCAYPLSILLVFICRIWCALLQSVECRKFSQQSFPDPWSSWHTGGVICKSCSYQNSFKWKILNSLWDHDFCIMNCQQQLEWDCSTFSHLICISFPPFFWIICITQRKNFVYLRGRGLQFLLSLQLIGVASYCLRAW